MNNCVYIVYKGQIFHEFLTVCVCVCVPVCVLVKQGTELNKEFSTEEYQMSENHLKKNVQHP